MIPHPRLRMLLVAALAASLVVNVFLVGYALRGQQEFIGTNPIIENVVSDYPAEVRSEFRNILRENRDRTLAAVRDLREARSTLTDAANASPFDEAEVRSAMTGVRSRTEALQGLMQEFLLEALKRISAQQRSSSR